MHLHVNLTNSRRDTINEFNRVADLYGADAQCVDNRSKKELKKIFSMDPSADLRVDQLKATFKVSLSNLDNMDAFIGSLRSEEMLNVVRRVELVTDAPEERSEHVIPPPFEIK